jgi:hypothetical protein
VIEQFSTAVHREGEVRGIEFVIIGATFVDSFHALDGVRERTYYQASQRLLIPPGFATVCTANCATLRGSEFRVRHSSRLWFRHFDQPFLQSEWRIEADRSFCIRIIWWYYFDIDEYQ